MWALVKGGKVDTFYGGARAVTINGIKYPKEMFTLYSVAEKKAIGIYNIVRKEQPDADLYQVGVPSYVYDSDNDVVNETFDITEKTINMAQHKADYKHDAAEAAHGILLPYAWLMERYVFDNTKAIPAGVKSYAAAVRTHCDTICTDVDSCSDLDDIKIVYAKLHDGGEYMTWPDESSIVAYNRIIN